jgi:bla regulator protein BlaR1
MKKNYKNIAIVIIFLIIGAAIGYTYSEVRNKAAAAVANEENNVYIKEVVNDNSDILMKTVNNSDISKEVVKELPKNSIESIESALSEIVIYNSHAGEDYPSGMKVTEVGSRISSKLVKQGLKSSFIKCKPPMEYVKAYEITRELIIENVEDYSNKILLDIHRDIAENTKSDTKKILLVLAKENPHYEENKKFADLLLTEFRKSTEVKSDMFELKGEVVSYFNQDLSNNSMLIEIGNNMSSDNDIEECINVLVSALKAIEENSV